MGRTTNKCLRTSMLAAACMTCGAQIGGHDPEAHIPLDAQGLCGHLWFCANCCTQCNKTPATTRNSRAESIEVHT